MVFNLCRCKCHQTNELKLKKSLRECYCFCSPAVGDTWPDAIKITVNTDTEDQFKTWSDS